VQAEFADRWTEELDIPPVKARLWAETSWTFVVWRLTGGETMAPLRVIVARERASERESLASCFAGLPGCEVIVDRRRIERRRAPNGHRAGERRCADRRTGHLDTADAVVLFVH
jgi:hypothetical protein